MAQRDPRVDTYIRRAADFARPILEHLRRQVHAACPDIEETLKWGFPHFLHHGIVCSMAAFKQHVAFGFWKHRLVLADLPEASGGREAAMGQFGRITAIADLPGPSVLRGYVRKAAQLNAAGIREAARSTPRRRPALVVPEVLRAALERDPEARATFEKFSCSHRKEYIEWITEAKREETRARRLATALAWLREGKPRHWKYAGC